MYTKEYVQESTRIVKDKGKHNRFSVRLLDKVVYFAYQDKLDNKELLRQDTINLMKDLNKYFSEAYIEINLSEGHVMISCCKEYTKKLIEAIPKGN